MLKPGQTYKGLSSGIQPPLGGCVLKLRCADPAAILNASAAFRRLCVETFLVFSNDDRAISAAFRRLCVETLAALKILPTAFCQPPLGGCVLKLCLQIRNNLLRLSRL